MPYESIHDPAELRIAVRELHRVRELLGQFSDVAAEMPGFGLEGMRAVKAGTAGVVSLLIGRAEARLRLLTARQAPPGVVVVDPERCPVRRVVGGLSVLPVVTEPMVSGCGLSSAVITLAAGGSTVPRVYPDADVIVVMVFGGCDLLWWDEADTVEHVSPRRHQHAFIRRGTRHCLVNIDAIPVTAVVVRLGADVTAGCDLIPDLADQAAALRQPLQAS